MRRLLLMFHGINDKAFEFFVEVIILARPVFGQNFSARGPGPARPGRFFVFGRALGKLKTNF